MKKSTDKTIKNILSILRHSGLNIWRIDCVSGMCSMVSHSGRQIKSEGRSIDFARFCRRFLNEFVPVSICDEIAKKTDIKYIKSVFEKGAEEIAFDVPRKGKSGKVSDWLKVVIMPMAFADGELVQAVVIVKNICTVTVTNLYSENGNADDFVGTVMDFNSTRKVYETLKYRAEYDGLTGIPNIQKFYADAKHILDDSDEMFAVLRMDIDKFKVINDVYGNSEGDKILIFIADAIKRRCADNVYARLGSDVFVILMKYNCDSELVDMVNVISEDIAKYPLEHKMKASFGICKIDNNKANSVSTLCDWANLAVKKIKGSMLFNYAFYDDALRKEILEEKEIEDEMHSALADGQFAMYLQPKYNIESSTVIGAEALVRWIHPTKGMIPPAKFIDLFEKNGFIIELDQYIWERACILLRNWIDRGLTAVPISINISRIHIYNLELRDTLINLVKKYDLPPRLLELELTESAFLDDMGDLYSSLEDLQRYGFSLAMDDFGSGYSSLNMLKNVPIDIIKIDREFLNETVVTERGKTVIRHTIAMAKNLDMRVVAEGVETIDQAAFLLESGCSIAQGFYYSRPVPVESFEELAFGKHEEKEIEPEINKVLSQNQDIVSIMLNLDSNMNYAQLIKSNTVSANELSELKGAFVRIINKYRIAMQRSDTSLLEVDFKTNTVLSTLREDSVAKDEVFTTMESIRDFVLKNANKRYISELEKIFDVDYIVEKALEDEKDIKTEFELNVNNCSSWHIMNMIPVVKDKQLERLIIAITDITQSKHKQINLESTLKETEAMLDMTDDIFYIWNIENNTVKLSKKAERLFGRTEIVKSDIFDIVENSESIYDADRRILQEHMRSVLDGGARKDFEIVIDTVAGGSFDIKSRRIINSDGSVNKIIGMIKMI